MRKRIVVIGGGPAGLAAAKEAARLGGDVTLVEQDRPGGRAMWHSLIPSKVWLNAMNVFGEAQHFAELGLAPLDPRPNPARILRRISEVKQRLGSNERQSLEKSGVKIVTGSAKFIDAQRVRVAAPDQPERELAGDFFIIATGSVPVFPAGVKPDGKRVLAPRMMSKLDAIPESLVMIGCGVTGAEFIYMFNQLGSRVAAVTDLERMLPRFDADISTMLETTLAERGVRFIKEQTVQKVINTGGEVEVRLADERVLRATHAFIAIGRRPDVKNLDIQHTSVKLSDRNGIAVNEFCQSSIENIYAVGDVAGAPMIANLAAAQGKLAAQHIFSRHFSDLTRKIVVEAVYAQPEVARVGMGESDARQAAGVNLKTLRADYSEIQKSILTCHEAGFLKVLVSNANDQILGASAIGDHAADLLTPIAAAMRAQLPFSQLQDVIPANPTLAELITALK